MSSQAPAKQTDAPKAKKQQAAKTSIPMTQDAADIDRKSSEPASANASEFILTTTQTAKKIDEEVHKIIEREFKEIDLVEKDIYVIATEQDHWGIIVGLLYFHIGVDTSNTPTLVFQISKWDTARAPPKEQSFVGTTPSTYQEIYDTLWAYTADQFRQYKKIGRNCQDWVKGALISLGKKINWKTTLDKFFEKAIAVIVVAFVVIVIIKLVYESKKENRKE